MGKKFTNTQSTKAEKATKEKNYLKIIGLNLKGLREANGLTSAQLLTKLQFIGLEISKSSYSRYENGEQQIPVLMLLKIADFYHVTLNDLTQKEIDDVNLYKPTTERLAEELEEIAKKLKNL